MKIKHFSSTQLHNHYSTADRSRIVDELAREPADVFVIGGDFFPSLVRSIEALAPLAAVAPVVYVPGNIDFYSAGTSMSVEMSAETMLTRAREVADRIGNIHLLQNESVTIGDTRFMGATLWTHVGDEMREHAKQINDFRAIMTSSGPWNIARQNREHDITIDFLENELSVNDGHAKVVVTHNSPHPSAVAPRYVGDIHTSFFSCDLSYMMEGRLAPDLWIAGSNPCTAEWTVGQTEIVSNGMGHPVRGGKAENKDFDFNRIVEVRPSPRHESVQTIRP